MNDDEGRVILLACIEDYEAASEQALRENIGYAEVIAVLLAALFGDWNERTD